MSIAFFLLASARAWGQAGQDTVVKRDSSRLACKVVELTATELRYRQTGMSAGSFRALPYDRLAYIRYADGSKRIVNAAPPAFRSDTALLPVVVTTAPAEPEYVQPAASSPPNPAAQPPVMEVTPPQPPAADAMAYQQGELDAQKSYHAYRTAANFTLVSTLLSPLIGTIVYIACAGTRPGPQVVRVPVDSPYRKSKDYKEGYRDAAYEIKKEQVSKARQRGNLIGLAVNVAVLVLILTSSK